MTGNDKNDVVKVSNRKPKWPFIVLAFVGSFFLVLILAFSSLILADIHVSKKELPEMAKDFERWYKNGFVGYSEWEGNYLHFPNSTSDSLDDHFDDYHVRFPLALSNDTVLEYVLIKDKNEDITEIRLSNWKFSNEKTLFRLSGKYYVDETLDGNVRLWLYDSGDTSYVINVETGEINQEELSEYFPYYFGGLSSRYGVFKSSQDGYLAILPKEEEHYISSNAIDDEIFSLLNKWTFKPYRSRLGPNGNLLLSFIRKTLFGQSAIVIMSYNLSDGLLSYQFFPVFTSYQDANRIIFCHNSLADKIEYAVS